ncbi:DUF1488 domain-containing protein [Vibrio sp. E150_011]
MNQSILFSDDITWNQELLLLTFHAHQSGMMIRCSISHDRLSQLSSIAVNNKTDAFNAYRIAQFDIEDLAEALIEDEDFDLEGSITIR